MRVRPPKLCLCTFNTNSFDNQPQNFSDVETSAILIKKKERFFIENIIICLFKSRENFNHRLSLIREWHQLKTRFTTST
ncbi:hypothetical protein PUN28_016148 [Cardiocondyla obscurior]|uniref:Uncharacterized protein n=1 Tax=Cardiocondyla obscurior TaxID=286306 RepID=A0AAW2EUX4_9HYME